MVFFKTLLIKVWRSKASIAPKRLILVSPTNLLNMLNYFNLKIKKHFDCARFRSLKPTLIFALSLNKFSLRLLLSSLSLSLYPKNLPQNPNQTKPYNSNSPSFYTNFHLYQIIRFFCRKEIS